MLRCLKRKKEYKWDFKQSHVAWPQSLIITLGAWNPFSTRFLEKIMSNTIINFLGQNKDIFRFFLGHGNFSIHNSSLRELLEHTFQQVK